MTMATFDDRDCGPQVQRALLLSAAWWISFIAALALAWTYWPEAREALAFGLQWLGLN